MIRAVIFDFDGLIIDTEWPVYQAWQEAFAEHGVDLPLSAWLGNIGTWNGFDELDKLARSSSRQVDRDQVKAAVRRRQRELADAQAILPGVVDHLKDARSMGLKTGIASSAERHWIDSFIGPRGLAQYFDVVRTRDDVERPKPHPDVFLLAARDLGIAAGETLVYEDSRHGLDAARAAGMYCVVVPNRLTREMDFSSAHAVMPSLSQRPLADVIGGLDQGRSG